MKLVETDADRAVKERLWAATRREALHFAKRCAEERVVGKRYSDGQRDVVLAAKAKGYPAWLVRGLSKTVLSEEGDAQEPLLLQFRESLPVSI